LNTVLKNKYQAVSPGSRRLESAVCFGGMSAHLQAAPPDHGLIVVFTHQRHDQGPDADDHKEDTGADLDGGR
jgi:hypothetical protein